MTLLSTIGYFPTQQSSFSVPERICRDDISIVVPVKDNQLGVDNLLDELETLHNSQRMAAEVIIVDNNSRPAVRLKKSYPFKTTLVLCEKPGPAAARNSGAAVASSSWLLFLDSDCFPTADTVTGYSTTENCHVAYAGNIRTGHSSLLARYYSSQEILIPPKVLNDGFAHPNYIVTANCLVNKAAYTRAGGFDERFHLAGGEDIDLGFRLLTIGTIAYQWNSTVQHNFMDGLVGFWQRFIRYGVGNRQLAEKYNLDLKPNIFAPNHRNTVNRILALIQYAALLRGYSKGYHNHIICHSRPDTAGPS